MNVKGYKNTEDTQKQTNLLRERWEYRLGTVSNKCHWERKRKTKTQHWNNQ